MDVRRELRERANLGMALGLEATRRALSQLGDPHLRVPCVHVTGTNGKGSTAAMIESIARAAGLRTGLYTSPHLCRVTEVIRIDGEPIEDAGFTRSVEATVRTGAGLTAFETLTVAAFHAFDAAAVDLSIIEVGLGGLRDATNVIERPLAAALTSVALEHAAAIGPTLRDVAIEKAGIFKAGAPVVLGPLDPDVDAVVAEVAHARGAGPITRVVRAAHPAPGVVAVDGRAREVALIPPPPRRPITATLGLGGVHQADNAGVAAAIAWILAERWPATLRAIPDGLARVRWPGRLERIAHGGVEILFDCAHNPHAIAALARSLRDEGSLPERTILVFGALGDKDHRAMIAPLAPFASRRIYTAPSGRRAVPLADLEAIAPGEAVADPREALSRALAVSRPGDTILVTGSSYLVGELRASILGVPYDPSLTLDLTPRAA